MCWADGELVLVSPHGEVMWRYSSSTVGLSSLPQSARDGSTIYLYGTHDDGSEGIWAVSRQGGEPSPVVAFDRVDIAGLFRFSVGPDRLYITVQQAESDIR